MAVPTNLSTATAIELGPLPNALFQRVDDGLGTTYEVFYKYTAQPGDSVIGVWAFGDLVTYQPLITVLKSDGVTVYLNLATTNRPMQFPVTPGQVYYFDILPNGGNPAPANLVISGLRAPSLPVPRGSFLIPDDTTTFPGSVVSAADGSVLRFAPTVPPSAAGIELLSGTSRARILISSVVDNTLNVFDTELNLVASVPFTTSNPVISRNHAQTFYVADPGGGPTHATIRTLSTAGVFGPTTWTFPAAGLTAIAPNLAETILYNAGQTASIGAPVKQWNLGSSTMGADLVAGLANYGIQDIAVLGDGTLIVLYYRSATSSIIAKQFNSGGTLLNTYTFTGGTPRLMHALDDPNSFWLWIVNVGTGGTSRYVNVKVSSGALLRDFSSIEFEQGIFQETATATPVKFGHSSSCPIVMITLDPAGCF